MTAARVATVLLLVACGRTEPVDFPVLAPAHGDAGARDDAGVLGDAGVVDGGVGCPVSLDARVDAQLAVTADNRRTVWLNGALVEQTELEWFQATRHTVSLAAHPSRENVIAVRAVNLTSAAGLDRGLLLDVTLGSSVVATDRRWAQAGVNDGGWNEADERWRLPGFDDSQWRGSVEQAPNGAAPWGSAGSAVDPSARWIWPYDSSVTAKPNVDPVLFRRVVYVMLDGGLATDPAPCP